MGLASGVCEVGLAVPVGHDSGAQMASKDNRASMAGKGGVCPLDDTLPPRISYARIKRRYAGELQAMAAAEIELRRLARSRLTRQDREDIIQEAFVRLYSREEVAEPVDNIGAFIRRTARNLLIDRFRAATHAELTTADETLARMADEAGSPERIILGRQAWEAVVRELDLLPEKTRTLFLQYRLGAATVRELAHLHQTPRSTVHEQIRGVVEKLNTAAQPYL